MKATATKSASKPKAGPWSTFDRSVRRAVRAALGRANSETAAAEEERRKWDNSWNREAAAKAQAKAKTAASPSWRTRWLNLAAAQRARARNNKPSGLSQRYAWPQYAGRALIYPQVHNSHVSDCVHVRVFDSRGVPVVRMSLTGTTRFIEGMVRLASREVARHELSGTLDNPRVNVWDETNGLPVEARLC
jgi:hypothetical protein